MKKRNKEKWTQLTIPVVKKMVEEFHNPDKDNAVKQYQKREEQDEK